MASRHPLQNPTSQKRNRFVINSPTPSICTRCGGLLVQCDFLNLMKGAIKQEDVVIRCVQCGDLVDRIIFQNRARQINALT